MKKISHKQSGQVMDIAGILIALELIDMDDIVQLMIRLETITTNEMLKPWDHVENFYGYYSDSNE